MATAIAFNTYPQCGNFARGHFNFGRKMGGLLRIAVEIYTQPYLQALYPNEYPEEKSAFKIWVNSAIIPNAKLVDSICQIPPNYIALHPQTHKIVAACTPASVQHPPTHTAIKDNVVLLPNYKMLTRPWDIFTLNGTEIENDFALLTKNKQSQPLGAFSQALNPNNNIFIAPGAKIQGAFLNATEGPIYIGPNAEIMEGSTIRGPFALCEGATVKMGAKIYSNTTIGPYCKIGGEVSNSVFWGYSNKAHDGFIGNSVIGAWCNLGADTNCSNLKNNYSLVTAWSMVEQAFIDTGLQFCGLIMADHSKAGINTMFNTGTVVGVCCNVFGGGFPNKYVPAFSWVDADKNLEAYQLPKALRDINRVMARRNQTLSTAEQAALTAIFYE